MALRHGQPVRSFPDFRGDVVPTTGPPVMRAPRTVEFRPTTDMETVVHEISRYSRVRVSAPAGAGKSTVLPRKLADAMGMPVVLAVPSAFLADDHYAYLAGINPTDVFLALEETDVVKPVGVTVTTYAWLTGKYLQLKGQEAPLGQFVLMADEVHESDAYSDFVRRMGSNLPGVKCFIEMSATHDPAGMQRLELKGKLTTEFFPRKDSPNTWDPEDSGKPWSIDSITDNVLIFVDNGGIAQRLQKAYASAGMSAYRLHSRMERKHCAAALAEVRNPRSGIVIIIADYSFRNGFTFDVSRIIDSALVTVHTVADGLVKNGHRQLYDSEKYQSMARGARTAGSVCTYYIPSEVEFESSLSVLEEFEMEASALLFRAYGYLPPVGFKSLKFPQDKFPRDFSAALNGFQPLALMPLDDMVEAVIPKAPEVVKEVADILGSYGIPDSPVIQTGDLFAGLSLKPAAVVTSTVNDGFLDQLQQLSSAQQTLLPGFYYYCAEAVINGTMGPVEVDALVRMVHDNPLTVVGLSSDMRKDAIARILLEYNKCTMMQAAMARVEAQSEVLGSLARSYPAQVKVWADWVTTMGREKKALANSYLMAVDKLRTSSMNVRCVDADEVLEQAKAKELVAPLYNAVNAASKEIDTTAFFAQIGGGIGAIEGPNLPRLEAIDVNDDGDVKGKVGWKTIRVGNGLMHDLQFIPDNPLHWDKQQYVAAVSSLMEKKGVVAESVRKLVIDAPGVNPDAVMQTVRDGMTNKKRLVRFNVTRAR